NGYVANGATHDLYFINSSNGVIKNNTFDTDIDPKSYNLEVKFSGTQIDVPGFDKMEDVLIEGNKWIKGLGMDLVAQAPLAENRRPLKRIIVKDNDFGSNGWARFVGVEDSYSFNNKGYIL